jgi:hypothetical protein
VLFVYRVTATLLVFLWELDNSEDTWLSVQDVLQSFSGFDIQLSAVDLK